MHPVMITIFGFPVHSYGVMLAVAFLAGVFIAEYRAKKVGLNPDVLSEFSMYLMLASIVGARLYYVILHWEEFSGNPVSAINPFANGEFGIGGLVMYGGFIGAFLAGLLFFGCRVCQIMRPVFS